ncbi:MAG: biotin/lipoyl-containing protein, partial [Georgfuchsia sp.]
LEGWAMECRINAEDPFRNFLPSTGRLVKYQPPSTSMEAAAPMPANGGVRVDTGVYEGGEISMFYDSMIAKLIVHGKDRNEAIARMREALNEFAIRGVSSNIAFQSALLRNPRFISGNFNTGLIGEEYPGGFNAADVVHEDPSLQIAVAAAINRQFLARNAIINGQLPGHEYVPGNNFVVIIGGEHHPVSVTGKPGRWLVENSGKALEIVSNWQFGDLLYQGKVNGEPFCMQAERVGLKYRLFHWGTQVDALVLDAHAAKMQKLMPHKAPPDTSKFLLSPMPGLLTEIAVTAGQEVKAGETLAKIEAMKMENVLKAERDCVVDKLMANQGESLSVDQIIIAFK